MKLSSGEVWSWERTVGALLMGGTSQYPLSDWYFPPVTDAEGRATLWLFSSTSELGYTLTADPPEGQGFATFSVPEVEVTGDMFEVLVLQFVHEPPITTAALSPEPNPLGLYSDPTTVTLTGTAAEGFTIAETRYQVDTGPELVYSGPFQVAGGGLHTLTFWSVDNLGVFQTPQVLAFEIVTNLPPVAEAGGPYDTDEGTPVTLDASGSTDPDDNIVAIVWDLDGDGEYDDATGVQVEVTHLDDASFVVELKVTDAFGEISTDKAALTVHNLAPVVDAGPDVTLLSGGTLPIEALFTDAGIEDIHSATVDLGDGQGPQPAEIEEADGQGTARMQSVLLVPGRYSSEVCVTDDDGGEACDQFTATVNPAPVLIDVKPGSEPNAIGCTNANGTISVAIFSSSDFDASTLDLTSLRFGPAEAPVRTVGTKGKLAVSTEDVNGDGLMDVVAQFKEADTGIVCGTTEANLTGQTQAGVHVQGTDDLKTAGKPEKG